MAKKVPGTFPPGKYQVPFFFLERLQGAFEGLDFLKAYGFFGHADGDDPD